MTFLPLLFLILITAVFLFRKPGSFRESILKAFLVTFFLIGFSTEVLSLIHKVNYRWILAAWLFWTSLAVLLLILNWKKLKSGISQLLPAKKRKHTDPSRGLIFLSLGIILLISLITLFIALKSPPNNFDSMTYHMARVSHWIQNQNIQYYPTAIPRQNYSMPLAEYAILHLQILSQGDHYANLVQWFSFVMSILTATLIAKQYKVSVRGQWITAVLAATLPMAILQSTSTQNDLVVSAFCLAFAYFLSKSVKTNRWENVFFAALSMGFALATKGTAYIFIAAIGLVIGGGALIGKKWGQIKALILRFGIIVIIGMLLNTGIYFRNLDLYKNPLITSNERTMVEEISPGVLFANLIRNGAVHLSSPVDSANEFIEKVVSRLLGSELNNPDSTFQESRFDLSYSINEDDAGNGFHIFLITITILILPWLKVENKKDLLFYEAAVVLSILLFSLVFKWQPWGGRLQTPIFILGCAGAGLIIDRVLKKEIFPSIILVLFLISSTPYLLLNSNRPLLPLWEDNSVFYDTELERKIYTNLEEKLDRYPGLDEKVKSLLSILYEGRSVLLTERRELYFLGNFEPYWSYVAACHLVRNTPSREIGLIMDSNDWEYPLWVFLNQNAGPGKYKIYHIEVDDVSGSIPKNNNPLPDLILITKNDFQDLAILSGYEQIYSSISIQVMKLLD
ncbi:MAG: glycosyltransferase family 39 protein [Anaerolineales bacterium]|nr:glycosyltransferase family 39 protein [Anaerolineales bacterium]